MKLFKSLFADVVILAKQSFALSQVLAEHPSLKSLCFQGKPINYYSTFRGMFALCASRLLGNFDSVAINHGIRSVRRLGYTDDLIWAGNVNLKQVSFDDAVTRILETNFQIIKNEINQVITQRSKFPDSDELTNKTGLWSWLSFYNGDGTDNLAVQRSCPETTKILKSFAPNLKFGFCFVSILEPNTTIEAHKGSSSLRYRYHLCIDADFSKKCGIRIGKKWVNWEAGKAFGFNDAIEHEVIYTGKKPRIVLIIDLWPSTFDGKTLRAISSHPNLLKLGVLNPNNSSLAIND